MPCNCISPALPITDADEWGPILWSILHGFAEKTSSAVSPLYSTEEKKTWVLLLKGLGDIVPCDECREHYKNWLASHPVDGFTTLGASDFRTAVRQWIYDLHESVNTRLGKSSFSFEDLSATYSRINILQSIRQLEKIEKDAIQIQVVKLQAWGNWLKYARMLGNIYGIY